MFICVALYFFDWPKWSSTNRILSMTKEKLPKLTESHIEELAYDGSIDRGKQYFRREYIDNVICHGFELTASCQGSYETSYSVRIKLHKKGIEHTSCSCPYDQGGICKHRVALLLTYIHKPESIRQFPPLNKTLGE